MRPEDEGELRQLIDREPDPHVVHRHTRGADAAREPVVERLDVGELGFDIPAAVLALVSLEAQAARMDQ